MFAVLELSRAKGDQYCFIFEDDATLSVPFAVLQQCINELDTAQPDWEISLFSVSQCYNSSDYTILGSGTELIHIVDIFNGTYAMAVSYKAYDKLINSMNGATLYDDVDIDIYSIQCKDHIYLALPFMCLVLSDQSDIRKYDTTGDLEQIKLCQARLLMNTSSMFS